MSNLERHRPQKPSAKKQLIDFAEDLDTSGSSIAHWSVRAAKSDTELSEKLKEPAAIKEGGLNFLKKHDLPRYRKVSTSLEEFIKDPSSIFTRLSSPTGYYYSSIVAQETGERIFGLEQNKEEVEKFILEKLANQEISLNSELILSEYWHNYYGGNLLIAEGGKILVELVEGKHAKLVKGEGQILMHAESSEFTEILNFEEGEKMEDELRIKLRQAVVDALNLIPKELVPVSDKPSRRFKEIVLNEAGEACVALPCPGYFEFILSKENSKSETWKIIFIDARTGEAGNKYQLLE